MQQHDTMILTFAVIREKKWYRLAVHNVMAPFRNTSKKGLKYDAPKPSIYRRRHHHGERSGIVLLALPAPIIYK